MLNNRISHLIATLWVAMLVAITVTAQADTPKRLLDAASRGNMEKVIELLELGVDVNPSASGKRSALMEAANGGHLEVVNRLA